VVVLILPLTALSALDAFDAAVDALDSAVETLFCVELSNILKVTLPIKLTLSAEIVMDSGD